MLTEVKGYDKSTTPYYALAVVSGIAAAHTIYQQ
jgi:hypothetical protein